MGSGFGGKKAIPTLQPQAQQVGVTFTNEAVLSFHAHPVLDYPKPLSRSKI